MAGLALALSLAACAPAAPRSDQVSVDRVQHTAGRLTFSGAAGLPDNACLVSQLLAGDNLVPDWPVDCILAADGAWSLSVTLGERGGPPELNPATEYTLYLWLRDDPAVATAFPFDLSGPAAPR
jgi:hypothetical protein